MTYNKQGKLMQFDERFMHATLTNVRVLQGAFPNDAQFAVDSRNVADGDIFIAIAGVHADGHDFIGDALRNGACGVMIEEKKKACLNQIESSLLNNKLIVFVADTLQALFDLAGAWRKQFTCPVIAVTGSVGKTSTKETIGAILRTNNMNCLVSYGNQNTKIGASLNLLKMRDYHDVAIFEVGINKRGEMGEIARLIMPTVGVITAIGHSHMEGLGSLHDIAVEKRDLFKYFTENNIAIVNGDLPILSQVSYHHPIIKFGLKTTNQIQARKIRIDGQSVSFILKIYKEKYAVTIHKPHMGYVMNVLAATAIANLMKVDSDVIARAIQQPIEIPDRFERQLFTLGKGGVVINDCYNASPESMKAALLAFQHLDTSVQKIAVLGDMLELGINSPFWHRQLGRFLRKVPSLKHVILVGSLVQWTKKTVPVGLRVDIVPSWQDAVIKLKEKLEQESMILVKGSFGMELRNVVKALKPCRIDNNIR